MHDNLHDSTLNMIHRLLVTINLSIEEAHILQTEIWLRVGSSVATEPIGEDHLD